MLRNYGLGAHADSWVGTGANMPMTGDQPGNDGDLISRGLSMLRAGA